MDEGGLLMEGRRQGDLSQSAVLIREERGHFCPPLQKRTPQRQETQRPERLTVDGFGAYRPRAALWSAALPRRSATSSGHPLKPKRSADFADGTEGEPQMSQMSADFADETEGEPVSAAKERKDRKEEGKRACQSAGFRSRQGAQEAFEVRSFP